MISVSAVSAAAASVETAAPPVTAAAASSVAAAGVATGFPNKSPPVVPSDPNEGSDDPDPNVVAGTVAATAVAGLAAAGLAADTDVVTIGDPNPPAAVADDAAAVDRFANVGFAKAEPNTALFAPNCTRGQVSKGEKAENVLQPPAWRSPPSCSACLQTSCHHRRRRSHSQTATKWVHLSPCSMCWCWSGRRPCAACVLSCVLKKRGRGLTNELFGGAFGFFTHCKLGDDITYFLARCGFLAA